MPEHQDVSAVMQRQIVSSMRHSTSGFPCYAKRFCYLSATWTRRIRDITSLRFEPGKVPTWSSTAVLGDTNRPHRSSDHLVRLARRQLRQSATDVDARDSTLQMPYIRRRLTARHCGEPLRLSVGSSPQYRSQAPLPALAQT